MPVKRGGDGGIGCCELFGLSDHAEIRHATQNPVPADLAFFRVAQRVVARWSFRYTRKHRVLGKRQLREGFPVVGLGRGLKTIGAMTEEDPVDVQLKNLLFAQSGLNLKCQQDFGELPEEGLIQRQKIVPRHLHCQRGASTAFFAGK